DRLDHLDLLFAGGGEHDVDRRRLLLAAVLAGRGGASRRGGGCDGGRRDAEFLLQRLDPLRELEHRDALELLDPLLGRNRLGRHSYLLASRWLVEVLGDGRSEPGRPGTSERIWGP